MATYKVREVRPDYVIIDADIGDGFDHSTMRVNLTYTDNDDLKAQLSAHVTKLADDAAEKALKAEAVAGAKALIGKTYLAAAKVV